jgi:hypothetical protein
MRLGLLIAAAALLAGCAEGRFQPGWSVWDPLCMPDGSVVLYEYPDAAGKYDETTAKRENCPWNKKK